MSDISYLDILFVILGKVFSVILDICGYMFIAFVLLFVISKIITNHQSKKMAKEAIKAMKDSNFMQEAFKKMTPEEREEFEKTGKVKTDVNLNINTKEITTNINKGDES